MTRISTGLAALLFGAGFAFQAGAADSHSHHGTNEAKSIAVASTALTEGEVRKVDNAAGKVSIKHGPMPKFDMPAMTMVYRVKEKAMLDNLKPGDKILFDVDGVGGKSMVLHLEKLP